MHQEKERLDGLGNVYKIFPCSHALPLAPGITYETWAFHDEQLLKPRKTSQRRKEILFSQWPTPVFLPGESQGRGSLVGCRLWGRTESDTTERLSSSGGDWVAVTYRPFMHFHSLLLLLSRFSHVELFAPLWTIDHQAPLPMVFPKQEYWSGLPSPGHLLDPGIEPMSPALAGGFFTTEPPGKPPFHSLLCFITTFDGVFYRSHLYLRLLELKIYT